MGQFDALISAANKAINNTEQLLQSNNTPFNVMYKQYKILQSFWFRVVEDASESNSKRLESLCIELEDYVQRCEDWIKENSPLKTKDDGEQESCEENNEIVDYE